MIDWYTLMELAKCGYINENNIPDEWHQVGKTSINERTGFVGKVFMNDEGEIVISYSGTDLKAKGKLNDLRNDFNMILENLPPQLENAKSLYIKIRQQYPNSKITLTGESLGGSMAALIGAETGDTTVTFVAYGVGDLINESISEYPNITNIGDTRDPIFMANINYHLGKTYIIPYNSKVYMPCGNNIFSIFSHHGIEHMGPLLDIQEYEKYSLPSLVETINYGEDYKFLNSVKNVSAEIYKKHDSFQSQNITGFKETEYFIYDILNHIIKKQKEHLKNIIKKAFPTGQAANIENGHWVTIDGNHVFIEDK